ncbi:hypothetical protein BKA82DRAFT_4020772 [Pisolithus tinctorius]|nr:hypothetical protein BKA82DRAFT_4020772 [Pisolithus tinctorius]
MAKGSTQKGMRMIGPTPGHWVKQLEVKTWRTGDSAFDGHESMSPPVQQLILLQKKTQNNYIHEWVPQKGEFLGILLELEASPEPRNYTWCGNNGVYRCLDCLHQPLFCTECCQKSHESLPFHRIQQWTGDFYEESALHMTGVQLHLGHGGAPCPHAITQAQQAAGEPLPMDDQEWEDVEDIEENPKHLCPPVGSRYLTVMDVTGVHFIVVNWCECETAEAQYIQLLRAKLFPPMFEKPSNAFTFAVLDDFLRDNLECGTSTMNYYSKLHQITSSLFPHLIPVRFGILVPSVGISEGSIRIVTMSFYGLHRNGDTSSYLNGMDSVGQPACPQPRINVDTNEDLDHWWFTCTAVMDGNFKAEHMHELKSEDQVWLMDGLGYMVTNPHYMDYLKATPHIAEAQKSTCNNHRAISQANAAWGKLHVTRIGVTACAQHGCFYPHCVVDFQKGERQLNMDYSLANALGYNMEGIKQVVCFYDINCSYMTNLQKHGAGWVDGEIIETLWSILNVASTSAHRMTSPHHQELLNFQMNDSNFMKMIWIVHAIKLALLEEPRPSGSLHGVASWLAHGLCLEEAITSLHMDRKDIGEWALELKKLAMACHADCIASEQLGFTMDAAIYLKLHLEVGSNTSASESVQQTVFLDTNSEQDYASDDGWLDNVGDELPTSDGTLAGLQDKLLLPSTLGIDTC